MVKCAWLESALFLLRKEKVQVAQKENFGLLLADCYQVPERERGFKSLPLRCTIFRLVLENQFCSQERKCFLLLKLRTQSNLEYNGSLFFSNN